MTKFICKACNYRFEATLDPKGNKCPYCGKETIVKEPTAEELLNDE